MFITAGSGSEEAFGNGDYVTGAVDVLPRDGDLFVLDVASALPSIVRFTGSGAWVSTTPLPLELETSLDAFLASSDGQVLLHAGGGAVARVIEREGQLEVADFALHEDDGREFSVTYPDAPTEDELGHEARIVAGGATTKLSTTFFVSSLQLLRVLDDGDAFWSMEEVTFDPVVLVDRTVIRVDRNGEVVGRARYPVERQYAFVRHSIAIGPDGNVLMLVAERDRAVIETATLTPTLEPVLPLRIATARELEGDREDADDELAVIDDDGLVDKQACLSRDTMISRGFAYVNSATWLTPANLDRPGTRCTTGRRIPRYFRTAAVSAQQNMGAVCSGTAPVTGAECVRSEPYDWGGWDTLSAYRSRMTNGAQAGDINTTAPNPGENGSNVGVELCSRGIDCSGFIGRVWDTPAWPRSDGTYSNFKPGSGTISRWTRRVRVRANGTNAPLHDSHPGCPTTGSLDPGCMNGDVVINRGDILVSGGEHVSMFRLFATRTIGSDTSRFPHHLESTKSMRFDRVSYWYWPWTRYDRWKPHEFIHACAP